VAITADGQAFSWGDNRWGQLGLGNKETRWLPAEVGHAPGGAGGALFSGCARSVCCGDYHTCIVAAESLLDGGAAPAARNLLTFGRGGNGQLGHGEFSDELLPRSVAAIQSVSGVAAGGGLHCSHTLVMLDSGRLFGFGSCAAGQLGIDMGAALAQLAESAPAAIRISAAPGGTYCFSVLGIA